MVFIMFGNENNGRLPAGHPNGFWGERGLTTVESINRDFLPGDYPRRLMRNNYAFDPRDVYPDYLTDPRVLVCPSGEVQYGIEDEDWYMDVTFTENQIDPALFNDRRNADPLSRLQGPRFDWECVTNQMYTYLPYAMVTEEQGIFLFTELARRMYVGQTDFMGDSISVPDFFTVDAMGRIGGIDPDADATNPQGRRSDASNFNRAPGGGNTFMRTAFNIGRFFIEDLGTASANVESDSTIPILFDTVSRDGRISLNHMLGGNVLYLDGHVEFKKYRGDPLTGNTPATGQIVNTQSINPETLFFSFERLPYTRDFIEFLRANVWDNTPLLNVPPWCGNRLENTPFEPRYLYYPNDQIYDGLWVRDFGGGSQLIQL